MIIENVVVKDYKILKDLNLHVNPETNILVGDNGSGKSTIMSAINLALLGRIGGVDFEHTLSVDDFNAEVRSHYRQIDKTLSHKLPEIVIEVYFKDEDSLAKYKGTNNSLTADCPGIRLTVNFNGEFEDEYRGRLVENKGNQSAISDIPIEYYRIQRHYFSGAPVLQQSNPFKNLLCRWNKQQLFPVCRTLCSVECHVTSSAERQGTLALCVRSHEGWSTKRSIIKRY